MLKASSSDTSFSTISMPTALPIARLLASPRRSEAIRRHSADDLARLRRISRLVALGVNLAGIGRILELEDDNAALLAENRAHSEKAPRKTKPS
jgi:DNA-binding transcriptional MerR regulator